MSFRLACLVPVLALAACASSGAPAAGAWRAGDDVTFAGRITAIDTDPWAYDGNARIDVASDAHGPVAVELPARWNLCKAPSVEAAVRLPVGTRVQVTARAGEGRAVVVCESATHAVRALP